MSFSLSTNFNFEASRSSLEHCVLCGSERAFGLYLILAFEVEHPDFYLRNLDRIEHAHRDCIGSLIRQV